MTATQLWSLFEGQPLFTGYDHEMNKFLTRVHLGEIIEVLGPPPLDLLQQGARSSEFFDEKGEYALSH